MNFALECYYEHDAGAGYNVSSNGYKGLPVINNGFPSIQVVPDIATRAALVAADLSLRHVESRCMPGAGIGRHFVVL